jgi:predicted RNA methylase
MHSDQLELVDRSLEQQQLDQQSTDADDARRTEYLERLRAALPELRKIEGFPIGTDEDILALSDPPYYTACPNPFLAEFIAEHGTPYDEATDTYHREPFAADVSEGKNDPIYNAHSYHTKVPHKAIMRYILHYTKPGDIVFDGFCGTGMTGVAAQLCGSPDPDFRAKVEAEWAAAGHPPPEWGARKAILNDLSPAATFIAAVGNKSPNAAQASRELDAIAFAAEAEGADLYRVTVSGAESIVDYAVDSDIFLCSSCGAEAIAFDALVDEERTVINKAFTCSECGALNRRSEVGLATSTSRDPVTGADVVRPRQGLGLVQLTNGQRVAGSSVQYPQPNWPDGISESVSILGTDRYFRDGCARRGITHSHHFFTARNWTALGTLARRAYKSGRMIGLYVLTDFLDSHASRRNRWSADRNHIGGTTIGPLTNTLFVGELQSEVNVFRKWRRSAAKALKGFQPARRGDAVVTTQTIGSVALPANSVDYIFTDPPFGSNIQYSELHLLVEPWLRVRTAMPSEIVVNQVRHKPLSSYQDAMVGAFREMGSALKSGHWITVVFHNSSNAVWAAIQESIHRAQLVVADVRVMDKVQGTLHQDIGNTVKQDLVISAYKPRAVFEQAFALEAGTEQGAWDFIREHLGQLPVFVEHDGRVEIVAERQNYLLFDRMVAFHIQRGATVPVSAARFYEGLRQRFLERDDMYFTEVQAADYDQRRLEATDVEQLSVFVVDEKSTIQWIRAELLGETQTFQELQPKFLQELNQNRFEALPELRDILDQNFLEDPTTHRWRVPDPGKQADLEALRTRGLLNEFGTYLTGTAKLKRFRLEAIRAGFADLWAKRDYRSIIKLAERLPDEVVQEDPALLMYYDNAVTREGAG